MGTFMSIGDESPFESKICNCFVQVRGNENLFRQTEDGILVRLDGYAVIPVEVLAEILNGEIPPTVRDWALEAGWFRKQMDKIAEDIDRQIIAEMTYQCKEKP
jgi:hypothetical protein